MEIQNGKQIPFCLRLKCKVNRLLEDSLSCISVSAVTMRAVFVKCEMAIPVLKTN